MQFYRYYYDSQLMPLSNGHESEAQAAATSPTASSAPQQFAAIAQTERPDISPWLGEVRLHYDRIGAQTRLASAWHQAPLKVQRPLYPEGDTICHTILIHTAGGMVGGDGLNYQVTLEPSAHALITTAAAGKVYRTPNYWTTQTLSLSVGPGACLEWLPQETILFAQAQFQQTLKVQLAPEAHWLGWDIYRFGRTARGERFMPGQWRAHTEVWRGNTPLWIDRQWLPGTSVTLDAYHGLNGYPVIGTLVWLGKTVESDLVTLLRSLWRDAERSGETGITRIQQGLLCRYRGHSTTEARTWFTQVWHHVRSYGLGRPACLPRVWPM
jgi:urease accessory protein